MRTVFNTQQVCHLWANQSQDTGRNSCNSVSFDGDTIYSYGSHFPMARHVQNAEGKWCILHTTASYSVTTSKHQSFVRQASHHIEPSFTVPSLRENRYGDAVGHEQNVASYRDRIIAAAKSALKARVNKAWRLRQVQELIAEGNAYAEFFGLPDRFESPAGFEPAALKAMIAEAEKAEAERLAEQERIRAERAEQARKEAEVDVERWLAGEDVRFPGVWATHDESIRLRLKLRDDGDVVQTSLGEEVPLSHAVRLLPLVRSGKVYEADNCTSGMRIGHFHLWSIDADGNITVGCHFIKREEIERLAAQLPQLVEA